MDAGAGTRALGERHRDVARIVLAAEGTSINVCEGMTGEDRNAVIALLAVDGDVHEPHATHVGQRKLAVHALGFLEAEHVGTVLRDEAGDRLDPQADGIDVPGGDRQAHAGPRGGATIEAAGRRRKAPDSCCPRLQPAAVRLRLATNRL